MPTPEQQQTAQPLDELDRRQDEVLRQIDQLNSDILALLAEFDARLSNGPDEADSAAA